MTDGIRRLDARALKAALHDGVELALLDAREEVPFDRRHLLLASCVPLGQLECLAGALVPRPTARLVWCDDGEGLAMRAAARSLQLGFTDVAVLEGGVAAWEGAGYPVYSGVHVPSKAFAEVVEHEAGTPWITAMDLQALMDGGADHIILDSRSYEEYHENSIPTAISVPGAELVYRYADLVASPDTLVVVNCGGRTRSIIGAQALINAGVRNRVVSLKDGTQAWHLAGLEVVRGATRRAPPVSEHGLQAALEAAERVARRFGVRRIDNQSLAKWRAQAGDRTLYLLDVRTPEEFEAGHLPGARPAPGGQLVQETDRYLAVRGARVVLVDDNGVRATMTASWLQQMGWSEVAVLSMTAAGKQEPAETLVAGAYRAYVLGAPAEVPEIEPAELERLLADGDVRLVDLADSRHYRLGHIPGAAFALRSRLEDTLSALPAARALVFAAPDPAVARLAASDHQGHVGFDRVYALRGGTAAWRASGRPLATGATEMLDPPDDIRLKAREESDDVEAAMRAYLAWEIDLVNQMAKDDDHGFKVLT